MDSCLCFFNYLCTSKVTKQGIVFVATHVYVCTLIEKMLIKLCNLVGVCVMVPLEVVRFG